jgi:hypothetical protein
MGMEMKSFWAWERDVLRWTWRQTWSSLKHDIKGIVLTIAIPIVLSLLVQWIPIFREALDSSGIMQEWVVAIAGVALVVVFALGSFARNWIIAPYLADKIGIEAHQKTVKDLTGKLTESTARIQELEVEKIPRVEVRPFACFPSAYEQSRYSTWAELQITNTSSSPLKDVSVQIRENVGVYQLRDEPDKGKFFLGAGMEDQWRPANVFWSESNVGPNQLITSIPAGATINAVVAIHNKISPALGYFNTSTHPPFSESKIMLEISSPDMNIWKGEYYIEYHPPRTDKFEFVEWGECARATNKLRSAVRWGGSQPE